MWEQECLLTTMPTISRFTIHRSPMIMYPYMRINFQSEPDCIQVQQPVNKQEATRETQYDDQNDMHCYPFQAEAFF